MTLFALEEAGVDAGARHGLGHREHRAANCALVRGSLAAPRVEALFLAKHNRVAFVVTL